MGNSSRIGMKEKYLLNMNQIIDLNIVQLWDLERLVENWKEIWNRMVLESIMQHLKRQEKILSEKFP